MKKIIIFLFIFSIYITAQSEMSSLDIFIGKWKSESRTSVSFEEWDKINETFFEGIGYSLKNGEKNIYEKFNILKLHNHIVYIAQPGNNLPTLFTLISSESNKFIFENKEHDFPQRVIYNFTSDKNLTASIEGKEKGEFKRVEYSFIKVD
jgi:hypothetical protein